MRVLPVSLLGIFISASLVTVAAAQPSKATDASKMAKDDCARARAAGKTCVLAFEADVFEGNSPKGDGSVFTAVDWGRMGSLIRLRRDFIPEIIKSAEDL
jgi:hypothetical protein